MHFFDISHTAFTVWGYELSYVELVGTMFGLVCVWLAARENIFTWPTGLINIVCFFAIFFQVRLYSDMFLQVFFFASGIYGWINWERQRKNDLPITRMTNSNRGLMAVFILVATLLFGYFIQHIHLIFPAVFPDPAAYPYADSFIAVASVVAQVLLARRVVENWVLWVLVDALAVGVYAKKEILFISLEYALFFVIAVYGLMAWIKASANKKETSGIPVT